MNERTNKWNSGKYKPMKQYNNIIIIINHFVWLALCLTFLTNHTLNDPEIQFEIWSDLWDLNEFLKIIF